MESNVSLGTTMGVGAKAKTVLAGVRAASTVATSALISKFDKDKGTKYLLESLGSVPGLSAKFSQILSARLGVDADIGKVHVPALPSHKARELIAEHQPDLEREIATLSEEAITASLGQVHRATLRSGQEVAIKIQYPGLEDEIHSQLSALFAASDLSPAKRYGLDMDSLEKTFRAVLSEELDYTHEATNQIEFGESLEKVWQSVQTAPWSPAPIIVPSVVKEFTGQKVLVQSWEGSTHPQEFFSHAEPDENRAVACGILSLFFVSLFGLRRIHGDMHLQNWGVRRSETGKPEVVLYDFGAILRVDERHAFMLNRLIHAHLTNQPNKPFDVFCSLGFDPSKLKYIHQKLPALCRVLIEPFANPYPWDFSQWGLSDAFDSILGEDKWWFRTAGPPWFLLLMKGFQGVVTGMAMSATQVPAGRIYGHITESLAAWISQCDAKPDYSVKDASALLEGEEEFTSESLAKTLKVLVKEGDREVVSMTLPARAIDDLANLIPADPLQAIERSGIHIETLVEQVRRSGYLPQVVFESRADNGRHYLVTLV